MEHLHLTEPDLIRLCQELKYEPSVSAKSLTQKRILQRLPKCTSLSNNHSNFISDITFYFKSNEVHIVIYLRHPFTQRCLYLTYICGMFYYVKATFSWGDMVEECVAHLPITSSALL